MNEFLYQSKMYIHKQLIFIIKVTEEGLIISFNDEHPEKALFPIENTDEEIYLC